MSSEIKLLEEILKRNVPDAGDADLANDEVYHYFYFENIHDPGDRERAWSVFPQQVEIRKRLAAVEEVSNIVAGWGYRYPKTPEPIGQEALEALIREHLDRMAPLIGERDFREFLQGDYKMELAGASTPLPDPMENDLQILLYEGVGDSIINVFPLHVKHYALLYNWAVYFTKCQEVTMYLLWPCISDLLPLKADAPDPGFRLWTLNCTDRFWIKGGDLGSKTICYRPPWLDEANG